MDKYKNYKLNFYECGFKAFTSVKINFSIQYLLLACFLVIYDTEFLILYPVMFNLYSITSVELLLVIFFFLLLLGALIIDYVYAALDWTI